MRRDDFVTEPRYRVGGRHLSGLRLTIRITGELFLMAGASNPASEVQ
jgi:hypothetical protein